MPETPPINYGARLQPRMKLYRRPLPDHPPFAMHWMVDELRTQLATAPAGAHGVQWVELGSDEETFDGPGGTSVKFRPSALMFAYTIGWIPTGVGGANGWIVNLSQAARQWMEVDRIALSNRIETLSDELKGRESDEGAAVQDKRAELEEAQAGLAQFGANASSYAETAYQALNSGVSGFFWKLRVPNVPIEIQSAFLLPAQRPFSLRFRRLKAPKEQARYNFTIFIANDKGDRSTAYALRVGADGNASEWFHFRSMKPARRKALWAAWDALEGAKYPTPQERKQLLEWEEAEQAIRAVAKKRTPKTLTAEESRAIDALKENARKLKEGKKLTRQDEKDKQVIERDLFIERKPFRLQEAANELLGKTVDITFQFLRAGYVVIQSAETRFIYENKHITGLTPPQYASGLPDGCRLTIQSDGNMFQLAYGHPRYATRGVVLSQPFSIPFGFEMDELQWKLDGDDAAPDVEWSAGLQQVSDPIAVVSGILGLVPRPARYQLAIELTGSGNYSPEVYSASVHLPASEIGEDFEVVYDSQNPGFPQGVSGNWIRDVLLQSGRDRSPECTVHLGLKNDAAVDPPLNLAPLVGDVQLHDPLSNGTKTLMRFGRVGRVPLENLSGLSVGDGTVAPQVIQGSLAALSLVGPLEWLGREIEAAFDMSGNYPNDVLRMLFRDGGLPSSLYARIGAGFIGIARISSAQPGRYPESTIAPTAKIIEIARDVVARHCPGWELVQDGEGLDLVKHGQRNRADLAFGLPPVVSVHSKLCLRGAFRMEQDASRTITGVTVLGARNRFTGVRYSHTETLPKMYQPGFENSVYWTGQKRHVTLDADESLTGVAACVRHARERLNITPLMPDGLAPWTANATVDFDESIRSGDLPRFFGVKWIVEDVSFGSLNAEEDSEKLHLSVRLAEDRRLEMAP